MRPTILVATLLLCCACKLSPTSHHESPVPPRITDVRWLTLVRDYDTAKRYTNVTVRIALDPNEYECSGGEIRVWLTARTMPPVLVFKLRPGVTASGSVFVIGVASAPVRDGVLRGRGVDYVITVENCTVISPQEIYVP